LKKIFNLRGGKKFSLGDKTLIMGILNVTPDSFSDGGKFFHVDAAIAHAEQLISDGADILDVGAESTRPGSKPISVAEEISRLENILPAIKNLDVPISIDTYKPEVAEFSLERGADIINDVYGLEDSRMVDVIKKFNTPVIVGHSGKCCDENIIDDIKKFFRMTEIKLNPAQIIFDVGIGFGKTQEEHLEILRRLDELKILDGEEISLIIGASRKSFIGWATGLPINERDEATGAICVHAISKGVDIVRVHNVKMISRMCLMADKLLKET
jgi:dihydropteroate synthase